MHHRRMHVVNQNGATLRIYIFQWMKFTALCQTRLLNTVWCLQFTGVCYWPDCVIICIQPTSFSYSGNGLLPCVKPEPAFSFNPWESCTVNWTVGGDWASWAPFALCFCLFCDRYKMLKSDVSCCHRLHNGNGPVIVNLCSTWSRFFFMETNKKFCVHNLCFCCNQFMHYEGQIIPLITEEENWVFIRVTLV